MSIGRCYIKFISLSMTNFDSFDIVSSKYLQLYYNKNIRDIFLDINFINKQEFSRWN